MLPLDEATAQLAERLRRVTVRIASAGRRGGQGSGVVWHPDGLIVTNAHVAHGERLLVRLPDGRELPGEVVARARSRDLAAIRVHAGELVAAGTMGAAALRPGTLVFAMGAPLGVPDAITAGIVHTTSTRDRQGTPLLVRADIRLAPGNSGGPLADARGRVVGINSMVVGGLGVAIATETVEAFLRRVVVARAA
ncbi:MAG TPA: trypsin-like peptidase domain-containing protein [Gemmatimonadaceae bacterium]|nr:trypsin-like peptidase domain-containing protein [Gemmatimonadaceae bacterium]